MSINKIIFNYMTKNTIGVFYIKSIIYLYKN